MREEILSVGIDIGTSTTEMVICRLMIQNQAASYTVPKIGIVEKEVVYRSRIYLTPLLSPDEIDMQSLKDIIQHEYHSAGYTPDQIKTGAVIITGETARKKNADLVLQRLSGIAGDFVVATAGPDLESVLASRGAGADVLSAENKKRILHMDIGGGTSNFAAYDNGILKGVACMDIGGRLIIVKEGRITYIYEKIKDLAEKNGISMRCGDPVKVNDLKKITFLMAEQLLKAVLPGEKDDVHKSLYTNGGDILPASFVAEAVSFSGGVADLIDRKMDDPFVFGDIGVLLAEAIKETLRQNHIPWLTVRETIGATVIGAGIHTTHISGSTIAYDRNRLPIKNIPVIRVPDQIEQQGESAVSDYIKATISMFGWKGKKEEAAIGISGKYHTKFAEIQNLAAALMNGGGEKGDRESPVIIIVENDIGKVLGNAVKVMLEGGRDVICIDGINVADGDYIDIGMPLVNGRVVPVIVKTLIFNS